MQQSNANRSGTPEEHGGLDFINCSNAVMVAKLLRVSLTFFLDLPFLKPGNWVDSCVFISLVGMS